MLGSCLFWSFLVPLGRLGAGLWAGIRGALPGVTLFERGIELTLSLTRC